MSQTTTQAISEGGARSLPEWSRIVEQALAGDRIAYAKLARLVTGYLTRWRAYDFRSDWEDIVQEVLVGAVTAHREGRVPSDAAFQAYVRQATRFKFVDQIRASNRKGPDVDAEDSMERGAGAEDAGAWPPRTSSIESAGVALRSEVRDAMAQLDPRERTAVFEVYVRGRTYDEAAEATQIPLGSLKRALRTGLARLREVLDAD